MKNIFRIIHTVLQIIGGILFLISGLISWGWYINWLDTYFLWRIIAIFVSILGLPFFWIFVIIEWIWHGFPENMKLAMIVWLISLVTFFISCFFRDSDNSEEKIDYQKIGGWLWIPKILLLLYWFLISVIVVFLLINQKTVLITFLFGSFLLVLSVLVNKFFQLKKSVPILMICFLSINTFSSFFLALNNNQNFIIPIFFIIWIIYFAKSKRVKRTFVQPDKKLSTIFFSILLLLIGGLTAIFDYEIREELKTGIEKNKTKENEILDKMSVLREETKKTKQAFATKILELKNEGNNEKELKNIFSKYKEDQKDYFKKVTPLFTEFKKTLSSSEVKQIEQMELLMKDFFTFEQNLLQEQIKCLEFWTDEPCLNLTKKWEDYEGKEEKFVQGIAKISGNKKLTVEKIYKDNLGEAIYEDLENFGTEIDDFHNLNDEGLNFYQKELYKEAINKFKEAINLNLETVSSADWATLYTNLSLAQQQLNLKEESKSSLEKALSFLEITNADYYVTKGELSLLNSNYDEAIINFKKALEIDPTNFSASNNLGIIYFDLDELGYEDYAKALSYNLIAYNSSADHNKLGVKKLLATF